MIRRERKRGDRERQGRWDEEGVSEGEGGDRDGEEGGREKERGRGRGGEREGVRLGEIQEIEQDLQKEVISN